MTEADELPLLGEPFAVELANSLYGVGVETRDYLATSSELGRWFAHAPAAADISVPRVVRPGGVSRCRDIRDAARSLLMPEPGGAAAELRATAVLNKAAATTPARLVLDPAGGWRVEHDGPSEHRFVAEVASRCVLFLGSTDRTRVRRCSGPGCSMLFVATHRNRRFCHESCSHGARQARYYRATRDRTR